MNAFRVSSINYKNLLILGVVVGLKTLVILKSSLDVGGLLEEADYYDYGIARQIGQSDQTTPTLGGFAAAVTVGVGVGTLVGSGTGVAAVRTIRSVAEGFGGVSSDPRPGPGLGGRAPTMMPLLSRCPPTECRVRSTVSTLHL